MPIDIADLRFEHFLDREACQEAMDEDQGFLNLVVAEIVVEEDRTQSLDMFARTLFEHRYGSATLLIGISTGKQYFQGGQINVVLIMLPHLIDEQIDPIADRTLAKLWARHQLSEFLM